MSLKLGTQDISGISQNTKYNAHHLLDFKWTDCIMNDVSWLRADTFSWQSGDIYVSAYNHLVADLQGTTAETETIGSYTVTFYRADDGHKICLDDQETTVLNIYNESGIAWYYIVDTVNTQFKLPRTKFGFEGLRSNVGDSIDAGLPNITGLAGLRTGGATYNGAFYYDTVGSYNTQNTNNSFNGRVLLDASLSSSIYGNSTTVQPPATQMYLYFYVGDYSQTAVEQTAGITAEQFNDKADIDLSNCTKPYITETYSNSTSWYRIYSDGWCEQGGTSTFSAVSAKQIDVVFLKAFADNKYVVSPTLIGNTNNNIYSWISVYNKVTTGVRIVMNTLNNSATQIVGCDWHACGYIS